MDSFSIDYAGISKSKIMNLIMEFVNTELDFNAVNSHAMRKLVKSY